MGRYYTNPKAIQGERSRGGAIAFAGIAGLVLLLSAWQAFAADDNNTNATANDTTINITNMTNTITTITSATNGTATAGGLTIITHVCDNGTASGDQAQMARDCPVVALPGDGGPWGEQHEFDYAVIDPATYAFDTIAQATLVKTDVCSTTDGTNGTGCASEKGYAYKGKGSSSMVVLETKPLLGTMTTSVMVTGAAAMTSSLSTEDGDRFFLNRTGTGDVTLHVFNTVQPVEAADVTVAPWFPQGADYVFACDATGFDATRFGWDFGDNQTQMGTRNMRVFHRYTADGTYTVTCMADNGRRVAQGSLSVTVTGAGNGSTGGSGNGNGTGTGNATYQVTIENLMPGQPLSPFAAVTHATGMHLFRVGEPATPQLETLAETGANAMLLSSVAGSATSVKDVAIPLRGTNTNESNVTFTVTANDGDVLSLAAMLGCTNDGFTGLDAASLPQSGTASYDLVAYDAGTENNTELSQDIPDGCNVLGPVAFPDDGNNHDGIGTNGTIAPHAGLALVGNLTSAHAWTDPVARVTITRMDVAMNGTAGNETAGNATTNGTGTNATANMTTTLAATLDGADEVPPTGSPAAGSVTATVDGDTLSVIGSFSGLEGNLTSMEGSSAHIHSGAPGVSGPVVFPLDVIAGGDSRSGIVTLTTTLDDAQKAAIESGGYYVNVHSEAFPEGEIRGQLLVQNSTT